MAFFKFEGWEELIGDESLGALHSGPAVITSTPFLDAEKFSVVHDFVWLSTGELEEGA